MSGHPTKGGEDYLELYRAAISGGNTVIAALSAFLIVLFLSIIFPIDQSLDDLRSPAGTEGDQMQTLVIEAVKARVNAERRAEAPPEPGRDKRPATMIRAGEDARGPSGDAADIKIGKRNILLYANAKEARAWRAAREQFERDKEQEEQLTSVTSFNILGFAIPVPNTFSCLAWFVAVLAMLFYIRQRRVIAFTLLAKAHFSWRRDLEAETPRDFAGRAPFWLAPVGWRNDWAPSVRDFGGDDAREALGWNREAESWAWWSVFLFLAVLIGLSGYVGLVGFELMGDNERVSRLLGFDPVSRDIFQAILFIAFLLCVLLAVQWLAPRRQTMPQDAARRGVLVGIVGTAAAAIFIVRAAENLIAEATKPMPNPPKTATVASAPSGLVRFEGRRGTQFFYLSPTLRVAGYPDPGLNLNGGRAAAAPWAELAFDQVRADDLTAMVELAALERLAEDRPGAVALLEEAALHMLRTRWSSVSYRLIDLLIRLHEITPEAGGDTRLARAISESLQPGGRFFDSQGRRGGRALVGLQSRIARLENPRKARGPWTYFRDVQLKGQGEATRLTWNLKTGKLWTEGT